MTILTITILIFAGSLLAGFLGSLTGLGGGVVIIPMLTLLFGVDIRYAIGASIVAVIATSSGAASAYVKEGISNIRLGMFLEIATTTGAIAGAYFAAYAPTSFIAIIFGIILLLSAALSFTKKPEHHAGREPGKISRWLRVSSSYPDEKGNAVPYHVFNVVGGFFTMMGAGILSGLLGIGSGALKVLAMDNIMKIPFKVSTTTSNFMIGVTAAASAVIYFQRGYIDPGLSMPVTLGVLGGSLAGSMVLTRARTRWLRLVFGIVITILAIEMMAKGISGEL